jgi:hypothetical protein
MVREPVQLQRSADAETAPLTLPLSVPDGTRRQTAASTTRSSFKTGTTPAQRHLPPPGRADRLVSISCSPGCAPGPRFLIWDAAAGFRSRGHWRPATE